ncbi:terpene synthase family protein [Streptomyces syringium]|uniref:terpene synthase family protein n=1 Tax=Streptomyces syringium TaxID=76729 RepID=UPI003451AD90
MTSRIDPITVPKLYEPFPSAIHPDAQDLEDAWMAAVDHYHLATTEAERDRIARTSLGFLGARMYPTGPRDRVQLAVELNAWITKADDQDVEHTAGRGDLRAVADHLLRWRRAIEDPTAPLDNRADGIDHYFRDLCARLHQVATPFQLLRMIAGIGDYVLGAAAESIYIRSRQVPGLTQYKEIRERVAGSLDGFFFILIEVVHGYELPVATVTDPDFHALNLAAQNIVAIANDIVSCRWEREAGVDANLPAALAQHHRTTLQDGIDRAADLHRQRTLDYETIATRILTTASPELAHYIKALGMYVQGLQDWYRTTQRYVI